MTKNRVVILFLASCMLFSSVQLVAQNSEGEKDTASFRKYDIFPAISYSPETKLTLGVIGYRYLDLTKTDPTTVSSFINFVAIYTTANQTIVESNWDVFTDGNKYRYRGQIGYNRFPDRNYGLGNDAGALVHEYSLSQGGIEDSTVQNYKRFSVVRFSFQPTVLKEVKEGLYAGLSGEIEYQWNYEELADSLAIFNQADEISLLENSTLGLRSGLGFNLVWDKRDNLFNPRNGSFIDLSNQYFGRYLGSQYSYVTIILDARKYFNPFSNHTIALRGGLSLRYTSDPTLPLRGLSRVGGSSFIRGYFNGTYQDNHVVAFESEYRLPFWKDDHLAPFYKFWKRLGMVAFLSGAQVFGPESSFGMDRFNLAVGTGIRVLFNDDSKVNLRIDYAWGLAPNSNGPGKKQTGLYFFLAEAF